MAATESLLPTLLSAATAAPSVTGDGRKATLPPDHQDAALDLAWQVASDRSDREALRTLAGAGPLGANLTEKVMASKDVSVRVAFLTRDDLNTDQVAAMLRGERDQRVLAAVVNAAAATPALRAAAVATGKLRPAAAVVERLRTYGQDGRGLGDDVGRSTVLAALVTCAAGYRRLSVTAQESAVKLARCSSEEFLTHAPHLSGPVLLAAFASVRLPVSAVPLPVLVRVAEEAVDWHRAGAVVPGASTRVAAGPARGALDTLLDAPTLPPDVVEVLERMTDRQLLPLLARHQLSRAEAAAVRSARTVSDQLIADAAACVDSAGLRAVWDRTRAQHLPARSTQAAAQAVLSNARCTGELAVFVLSAVPEVSGVLETATHLWAEPQLAGLVLSAVGSPANATRILADLSTADRDRAARALVNACAAVAAGPAGGDARAVWHAVRVAEWVAHRPWFPADAVGCLPMAVAMETRVPPAVAAEVSRWLVGWTARTGQPLQLPAVEAVAAGFAGTISEFFDAAQAALTTQV